MDGAFLDLDSEAIEAEVGDEVFYQIFSNGTVFISNTTNFEK